MALEHRDRRGSAAAGVAPPYIETLVARLAAGGVAPALRHEGRDTAAAELLASIFRYARALLIRPSMS